MGKKTNGASLAVQPLAKLTFQNGILALLKQDSLTFTPSIDFYS